jgi:hypothetical protein
MQNKEDKLIILSVKNNLDVNEKDQLEYLLRENLNWHYLLKRLYREEVHCLVYRSLVDLNLKDFMPTDILEYLQDSYYKNFLRNTFLVKGAKKVIKSFKGAGINLIILKGIFLAGHIYKNIALRPMSDIDILINKIDLSEADRVLNCLGYTSPAYYQFFLHNTSTCSINTLMYRSSDSMSPDIHLHWNLINSTWPLDSFVRKIDIERIFSYAQAIEIEDVDTLTLSVEHLLIYLSHHNFNHFFNKLILLCDIQAVLNHYKDRLDWRLVNAEAERFGLLSIIYHSLSLTCCMLDFRFSEMGQLRIDRDSCPINLSPFFSYKNLGNWRLFYFVYLLLEKGFLNKLRFLGKTILPPHYVLAHNFNLPPSQINFSHYFFRLIKNIFRP